MGNDVELHLPPEIHVGGGVSERAGELASALGLQRVLVVTAREDLEIARQVRAVLGG